MKILNQNLALNCTDTITVSLNEEFKLPNSYTNALAYLEAVPKRLALKCGLRIWVNGKYYNFQSLMPNLKGKRYINLSNLPKGASIKLEPFGLRLNSNSRVEIQLFSEELDYSATTLLIAPHPDDIEISSFATAMQLSDKYLVTLSAGDQLKKLKDQYLPGLYKDLASASLSKGKLRAFNALTTALLYGVRPERNIMLSYPDTKLLEMSLALNKQLAFANSPSLTPKSFRSYNSYFPLASKLRSTPLATGESLISELVSLIDNIKPKYIFITNPLIDTHRDHQGAALLLAKALKQCKAKPQTILMYVNHVEKPFNYPYGPIKSVGDLPMVDLGTAKTKLGFISQGLTNELLAQKADAFLTIPDLMQKPHLKKTLKIWLRAKWFKEPYIHPNYYFCTSLKANECFLTASNEQYLALCQELEEKLQIA